MGRGRNKKVKRKRKRVEREENGGEGKKARVWEQHLGRRSKSPQPQAAHSDPGPKRSCAQSTPSIFSSDVTQVTSVPLGQLVLSPGEIFYYLPWDSHVKGLGFHRPELHCAYIQTSSVFNINDMTANII